MPHFHRVWPFVAALLAVLILPGYAQAKRFKRYPNDVKEQEEKAAARQPPRRAPEGPAEDQGGGEEYDYGEPEEAPGLFGYALHGRGGLTVEYIYTGEVFTNMRGGLNTTDATEYRGNIDLVITADLDEMGFAPGGVIFIYGENGHGRGITERHVGDFQTLSNIDEADFVEVAEFWWERGFFDGLVRVRLGKQDCNIDFAVVDLGGDFTNSSFGFQPNIPFQTFPDPSMAAVVFLQMTEWLEFKAGVWDGAGDGRTWGFSGEGVTLNLYEFKAEWGLLDGRLPGDFHIGMWYHSGRPEDPGNPDVTFTGNHGVYMGLDQLVFKESWEEGDDQGLGVFAQFSWAPEERNEIHHYVGGGLVYKGLIPCRDDDITGVGVAQAIFSDRMGVPRDETAIEVFHKIPLSPYFMIQPDLQYIAHPSGVERDAVVFGLRFEVVL